MSKNHAVLSYPRSNNLGDLIQSLAAKQFLNKSTVVELDRDKLNKYKGEKLALVMNGWFIENSENWPPSEKIDPLFISFHLNPIATKGILSDKGIAYFKRHQPIGCRDHFTQNLLSRLGIDTYYSACLTLSLKRQDYVSEDTKREGIHVISAFERLNPKNDSIQKGLFMQILQNIKKPYKSKKYKSALKRLESFLKRQNDQVYWSSQLLEPKNYSQQERLDRAVLQLKNIATARLVITSRIHTALPAVAFGTPVLFLSDGLNHINHRSRFDGMEYFFPILRSKDLGNLEPEFLEPDKLHLPYVKRFENKIRQFLKE
ncbi:MAG: hypothetical protein CBD39_04005 [Flavobacteriaceae bacterium TMED179]|nr:MAG: hypothetical protein CBD39_04005 [Flavobacteriaceae bacterium TMED179]|tara:strand:- start:36623 stop:37570 length:948 start_codon:yes stop_codon:yes gene_type:complete